MGEQSIHSEEQALDCNKLGKIETWHRTIREAIEDRVPRY